MKKSFCCVLALLMLLACACGLAEFTIIQPGDQATMALDAGNQVHSFKFIWEGGSGATDVRFYEDDGSDSLEDAGVIGWYVTDAEDTHLNVQSNAFRNGGKYVGVFTRGGETRTVHFMTVTKVSKLSLDTPDVDAQQKGILELDGSSITFIAWDGASEDQGTTWSILAEDGTVLAGGTTDPGETDVMVDRANLDDGMKVTLHLEQGEETVDYHFTTAWVNIPEGSSIEEAKALKGEGVITIKAGVTTNVRSKPGKSGQIVGKAYGGERYLHMSTASNGWLEIRLNTGVTGYISPNMVAK